MIHRAAFVGLLSAHISLDGAITAEQCALPFCRRHLHLSQQGDLLNFLPSFIIERGSCNGDIFPRAMIVRCPYFISSRQKVTFPLRETMCFLEKMQAPSVHQLDDDNLKWDAPEKKTTFLIRQGPYFRRHEGRIVAVQTCCSTDSSNCAVDVTIRNVECTRRRGGDEGAEAVAPRTQPRAALVLPSLFG